jgi:hypothetical protein
VFPVELARPRDVFRIHAQEGFEETYGEIWECFRSEVIAGAGATP